jgi:hypothetical protein
LIDDRAVGYQIVVAELTVSDRKGHAVAVEGGRKHVPTRRRIAGTRAIFPVLRVRGERSGVGNRHRDRAARRTAAGGEVEQAKREAELAWRAACGGLRDHANSVAAACDRAGATHACASAPKIQLNASTPLLSK